jgi:DNA-directed RNA polymerase I, II, and III subunit RPABC1
MKKHLAIECKYLYTVYKTLCEMLQDRGYVQVEIPSQQEFIDKFRNEYEEIPTRKNLTFITRKKHKPTLVYFLEGISIGKKHMVKVNDIMNEKEIKHCILVYPETITFSARKYLVSKKAEIQVELFTEDELVINRIHHVLSPKYEVMNSTIIEANIKPILPSSLPIITNRDPIFKYYGLKRDSIIKVVRKSETSGEYITYRRAHS